MRYAVLFALLVGPALAGDEEPALVRALSHPRQEVRHKAAVQLAKRKQAASQVVPVLVESLENKDWYTRWQACLGLCAFGPAAKEAVPALLPTLCDEKQDVSREALLALREIAPKDEKVVLALKALFHSDHPVDMRLLLFAVEAAGDAAQPIEPELVELVDGRGRYSTRAFFILEGFGMLSPDALRAIEARRYREERQEKRAAREKRAAEFMREPTLPSRVKAAVSKAGSVVRLDIRGVRHRKLVECLDEDPVALAKLGEMLTEDPRASLASSLRSRNEEERACAVFLLSRLGRDPYETRRELEQALRIGPERVRRAAAEGLAYLGKPRIERLIVAWESRSRFFEGKKLEAELAVREIFERWKRVRMWMPDKKDRELLERVPGIVEAYFKETERRGELGPAARVLVEALTAHYRHLREAAIGCLRAMYGTDHGYSSDATRAQREKNAEFWHRYLDLRSK